MDLAKATGLIEALEAELMDITTHWSGPDRGQSTTEAPHLILAARTHVRRMLIQSAAHEPANGVVAPHDLRVAEIAFGFLLRLRRLQRSRSDD